LRTAVALAKKLPLLAVRPEIALRYAIGGIAVLAIRYLDTGDLRWIAVCSERISIWRQRNGRLNSRIGRQRGLTEIRILSERDYLLSKLSEYFWDSRESRLPVRT
jgi:hypothetical protein